MGIVERVNALLNVLPLIKHFNFNNYFAKLFFVAN